MLQNSSSWESISVLSINNSPLGQMQLLDSIPVSEVFFEISKLSNAFIMSGIAVSESLSIGSSVIRSEDEVATGGWTKGTESEDEVATGGWTKGTEPKMKSYWWWTKGTESEDEVVGGGITSSRNFFFHRLVELMEQKFHWCW